MINRTALLVKMGIYMSNDQLVEKVESCILAEADLGHRQAVFAIPDKTNKIMIDALYSYLEDHGYRVIYEQTRACDAKYYLPGKKIIIEW